MTVLTWKDCGHPNCELTNCRAEYKGREIDIEYDWIDSEDPTPYMLYIRNYEANDGFGSEELEAWFPSLEEARAAAEVWVGGL